MWLALPKVDGPGNTAWEAPALLSGPCSTALGGASLGNGAELPLRA